MNPPVAHRRCVALTGRATEPRVGEAIRALVHHLVAGGYPGPGRRRRRCGYIGLADIDPVGEHAADGGAELLVAVARATARCCMRPAWRRRNDVPVLGINRGRLGFLADVGPERMLERVDDALAGRCQRERRMLLSATVAVGRPDGVRARVE